MNEGAGYIMKMVLLYLFPFLLLFIFKNPINRHFRRRKAEVRIIDLLVPYFVVGIHIFSTAYLGHSLLPYFLIFVFAAGIVLTFFFVFKLKELEYTRFIRVWWRVVFLFSFLLFIGLGAAFFISALI